MPIRERFHIIFLYIFKCTQTHQNIYLISSRTDSDLLQVLSQDHPMTLHLLHLLDEILLVTNPSMSLHLAYGMPSLESSGRQNPSLCPKRCWSLTFIQNTDLLCVFICIVFHNSPFFSWAKIALWPRFLLMLKSKTVCFCLEMQVILYILYHSVVQVRNNRGITALSKNEPLCY